MTRLLLSGGTGSLGKTLLQRLANEPDILSDIGLVVVFSRDEDKQRVLKGLCQDSCREIVYRVGDVRDYNAVENAVLDYGIDCIINAAALKQVPFCEFYPTEAYKTNVVGMMNILDVAKRRGIEFVVGISTDKACKPINAMGISKAMMEKLVVGYNDGVRKVCVRYGNVVCSRGSVIPFFVEKAKDGLPLPITDYRMTRFLLSLHASTDTILFAINNCVDGDICVPACRSTRVVDIAKCVCGIMGVECEIIESGIRPGEKIHEVLIHEDELQRTRKDGGYFIIGREQVDEPALSMEYVSSREDLFLTNDELRSLIEKEILK